MSLGTLRLAVKPLVNSLILTRQKLFSPKYLLYTNTALTVGLSVTGDILQQGYQASNKKRAITWDPNRTLRLAVTGLVIGPFVHYWYIYLDRWFPGKTVAVLCRKVLLDQVVCSPIYLSLFMLTMGLLENKTFSVMKQSFIEKGPVLYIPEWIIWPPAQFINFYFLPTKYRVLYDNTISLAFDCFWSYVWYEMDEEKTQSDSDTGSESKRLTAETNESISESKRNPVDVKATECESKRVA